MIDDPCDDWSAAFSFRRPKIAIIQRHVADVFNVPLREMVSACRTREIARPRQVAMYLSGRLTAQSLSEIGRRFGGRDHTTVIHAMRQIEHLRRADEDFDASVSRAQRQIEAA